MMSILIRGLFVMGVIVVLIHTVSPLVMGLIGIAVVVILGAGGDGDSARRDREAEEDYNARSYYY